MLFNAESLVKRSFHTVRLSCDLAVTGGGMAGVCAAIAAARAGLKVVLIQDRPVLGGNASSEVRLWILGATSHMGNNNRWAREGGVIDEILVENFYRNPEGNPVLVDALLLEKVTSEPNITLLLDTSVFDLDKKDADTIARLRAYCSQNETTYEIEAPLFCDASGDGVVGFMAGAAFRMGAEGRDEFGEGFAPAQPNRELLGHSIYFYSRDTGRPVKYVPPSFALKDITAIPRHYEINAGQTGCNFWWLEYGGVLDTITETEKIKWELWRVVYGVWDHIKNSGKFPEAETMTLEWVGTIPGKRESRRFEGDYILTQRDLVEQHPHEDAAVHGGWAMDLHPADGVYSPNAPCIQWHAKGVYEIPFRCYYSRNVNNLFLAGRIISTSHVAFGSTRVMATCAAGGQMVGTAAALCHRHGVSPRELGQAHIRELQQELLKLGHYIPRRRLEDSADLARQADLSASSRLRLNSLPANGTSQPLTMSWAMMLPVKPGPMPAVTFEAAARKATTLELQLRVSSRPGNHTPDVTLARKPVPLAEGPGQKIKVQFDAVIEQPCYAFICAMSNPDVDLRCSDRRVSGVLAVSHNCLKAVATSATQQPPAEIGIESFEFWTPKRRPNGYNLAVAIEPALDLFGPENAVDGVDRPTSQPHAWVADPTDPQPRLTLRWKTPQTIRRVELVFDTDFDHPMESVQWGHPEREVPFCVQAFRLLDGQGRTLAECADNHQTHVRVTLPEAAVTDTLTLALEHPSATVPAALFAIRCYA